MVELYKIQKFRFSLKRWTWKYKNPEKNKLINIFLFVKFD
jgi:hypothetical protein